MTVTASSPIAVLKLPAAAIKALADAKIDTVGKLTDRTRAGIANTWLRQYLGDIDKAFAKHNLEFAPEGGTAKVCASCPKCETCGNPRATTAKAIVTGVDGTLKHLGFQKQPTCDDCQEHHRAVLGMVVKA